MIYGVGVDMLRIERGEQLWKRFGAHAADKLLLPQEREIFAASHNPGRYLARAWCAKEAFLKALGTGFRGIGFREVGAMRPENERPQFIYDAVMAQRLKELGITAAHLSFSDEDGLILAFAVLECGTGGKAAPAG